MPEFFDKMKAREFTLEWLDSSHTLSNKTREGRDLYNTHKQPVDDLAKNILPPREWTILHLGAGKGT